MALDLTSFFQPLMFALFFREIRAPRRAAPTFIGTSRRSEVVVGNESEETRESASTSRCMSTPIPLFFVD